MIPSVPAFLAFAMQRLAVEVAPVVGDEYLSASTAMMGGMMAVAAKEADRAADTMIWEIQRMKVLLAEASEILGAPSPAPDDQITSYRLSALHPINSALSNKLIEVHEKIEQLQTAQAGALCARIWEYLIESAERRRIDLFD